MPISWSVDSIIRIAFNFNSVTGSKMETNVSKISTAQAQDAFGRLVLLD